MAIYAVCRWSPQGFLTRCGCERKQWVGAGKAATGGWGGAHPDRGQGKPCSALGMPEADIHLTWWILYGQSGPRLPSPQRWHVCQLPAYTSERRKRGTS